MVKLQILAAVLGIFWIFSPQILDKMDTRMPVILFAVE